MFYSSTQVLAKIVPFQRSVCVHVIYKSEFMYSVVLWSILSAEQAHLKLTRGVAL